MHMHMNERSRGGVQTAQVFQLASAFVVLVALTLTLVWFGVLAAIDAIDGLWIECAHKDGSPLTAGDRLWPDRGAALQPPRLCIPHALRRHNHLKRR